MHISIERAARGCSRIPHTRSILDTGVVLDKPDQLRVDNLSETNGLPVTSLELGIAALCWGIVEKLLQGLLCEGGLA